MHAKAHKPVLSLSGKRILVSRAREQASVLSEGLQAAGAEVVEIPFIEIREPKSYATLDYAIHSLPNYDWLIVTSVNGVEALMKRMEKLGKSEADLLHLNIAAIGPATRKAIEDYGLPVDVEPEEYIAEAVVEALRDRVRGKRVLLARAKVARDVIPNELDKLGARVDVVVAYETVLPESSRTALLEALQDRKHKLYAITFTSSSTARNFVELLGDDKAHSALLDGVKLASIGPVTSSTLRELGLRVDVEASEYTIPGLIKALSEAK
ncbi:MAG TPA: uroporphyrinogen-III synthase [Terriglobales bacterium]|nr:uroporphyrinogen-III synthase [Terriglobales bacterium]